jgi:hypothetical protein
MAKAQSKNSNPPIQAEILEGQAMYAKVHTPDEGNAKYRIGPAYKLDLMLTDPEQVKKAESLNLKIKQPAKEPFTHPYVTLKSKVKEGRNGPRVMDSQRNIIPPSILIGNGSKVRTRFIPFSYGEGEVAAILLDVQVLELVKFEPKEKSNDSGGFLGKVEGGFVAASTENPEF